MHIRIGTRGSELALAQTNFFIDRVKSFFEFTYEVVIITTTGDKITDKPLYNIGGKALFLKEIEEAMIAGKIDCAVHSMKDVPARLPDGLMIGAVLEREDPRDVLIANTSKSIIDLPKNAKVGTSSVRRAAQIYNIRPDIEICSLRGNVPTRIEKWRNSDMDGIILAAAGLKRLSLYNESFCHMIDINEMIPAVGQGAIGIEIKSEDTMLMEICSQINHIPTSVAISAERGFLEYLDADCTTPLAAHANFIGDDEIEVIYMLASDDFKTHNVQTKRAYASNAYSTGEITAMELKKLL